MKPFILFSIGCTLLVSLLSCTKPMVIGHDRPTEPIRKGFSSPSVAVFEAAEQALKQMDFKVEYADQDQGVLRTGWVPTTADSHYIELFGQKDFGVTNSYYHLAIRIEEGGEKVVLEVSAPLRTMVAKMQSSHFQEKRFLSKVKNLLRSADFKVTNVGAIDE